MYCLTIYVCLWRFEWYRYIYTRMGRYLPHIVLGAIFTSLCMHTYPTLVVLLIELPFTNNGHGYIMLLKVWLVYGYSKHRLILNNLILCKNGSNKRAAIYDEHVHNFLMSDAPFDPGHILVSPMAEAVEKYIEVAIYEELICRFIPYLICYLLDIDTLWYILTSSVVFALLHNITHAIGCYRGWITFNCWTLRDHTDSLYYTFISGIRFAMFFMMWPSLSMAVCLILWHFVLNLCTTLEDLVFATLWTRHFQSKKKLALLRADYSEFLRANTDKGVYQNTRIFLLTRFKIPRTYFRRVPYD